MEIFLPRRTIKKILILVLGVFFVLGGDFIFFQISKVQERIVFFDVGEGDSALIQLKGSYEILIDGGPDNKVLEKLEKNIPFWDKTIEVVIISHPHADHIQGLIDVLEKYKVNDIYYSGVFYPSQTYINLLTLIKKKEIPLHALISPQEILLPEKAKLSFLYPTEDLRGKEILNLNNSSLVVRFQSPFFSCLFMGDAEEEVEDILLEKSEQLKSDFLKLAHHGADNASTLEFLQAVSPQIAVISVGKNNDFHLPSLRTIKRLKRLGIGLYRTDQDGDIEIRSKKGIKNGFVIKKE